MNDKNQIETEEQAREISNEDRTEKEFELLEEEELKVGHNFHAFRFAS